MEQRPRVQQTAWGLLGAAAAAWFAIWMLFFPQYVPEFFAWDVHPRAAQVFIGAAYSFRASKLTRAHHCSPAASAHQVGACQEGCPRDPGLAGPRSRLRVRARSAP
jgi:hypothetical protein